MSRLLVGIIPLVAGCDAVGVEPMPLQARVVIGAVALLACADLIDRARAWVSR